MVLPAVSLTVTSLPRHTGEFVVIDGTKVSFTVTVAVAVLLHPLASVPVTVQLPAVMAVAVEPWVASVTVRPSDGLQV